jgi:hypothetical protein
MAVNPTAKWREAASAAGWTKAGAQAALAEAAGKADLAIKGSEAAGLLPKVTIPDSDEELAKLVLRELCVIALGRAATTVPRSVQPTSYCLHHAEAPAAPIDHDCRS